MQTLAQLMDRMASYYRDWYEVVFQHDRGCLIEIRLLDRDIPTVSVYYKAPGASWTNCYVQLEDMDWQKKVCTFFCQNPDEEGWYVSDATLINIDANIHVLNLFREEMKTLIEKIKNESD